MNSLRTGDLFAAKAPGRWVSALWRTLHVCSGTIISSACNFHPVVTSAGFLPSGDPRAHFGSGTERKVASIDVRPPSGIVQTLTGEAADKVLKIEGPPK